MVFLAVLLSIASSAFAENAVWMSGSVRSPKEETRIVSGDTLSNPIDWQVQAGYRDGDGWIRGESTLGIERQNGIVYPTQEHRIVFHLPASETGLRVADLSDKQYYIATWHFEARKFNRHVGIGFSRTWFSKWFQNGAWMARTVIEHDSLSLSKLSFALRLVWESSRDFDMHGEVYSEIRNLTFGGGRYALVPFFKAEFIDNGSGMRSQIQGKVRFDVILN